MECELDCFNHKNESAVGICKSCSKGVCHNCLNIINNTYVSCSEEICKTNILEEYQIVERSKKIYGIGKYRSNKPTLSGLFYCMLGILLVAPHVYQLYFNKSKFNILDTFSLAFGCLILVWGIHLSLKKDKINC